MNKPLIRLAIKNANGIATANATISQKLENQFVTDVATSAKSYDREIDGIDILKKPPVNHDKFLILTLVRKDQITYQIKAIIQDLELTN